MSSADEIIKLKELLDNNVITKEEFEKKKSELLNQSTSKNMSSDSKVSNKQVKAKKKMSIGKIVLITLFVLYMFGNIIENTNTTNTIKLIDGQAGRYGKYDTEMEAYAYYIPEGTYKIISYKDNSNRMLDLFDWVIWKCSETETTNYSIEGKQYRKSLSDTTMYTTELPDTFTISTNEYVYLPADYSVTLEIIE